jgi:hypothetical protein
VVRYSFLVRLLPPLLHAGLARRTNIAITLILFHRMSVNAFHENAVYVKREFAILMLFLLLSFLKPTFLS